MSKLILGIFLYGVSPLLYVLFRLLRFFHPQLMERWQFEEKNLMEKNVQSKSSANFAFEVSSEGELELVLPLLNYFLEKKYTVELIYCSASVETKVQRLHNLHPHLRTLRLPLVTYFPIAGIGQSVAGWMTAPVLFMCRYDFFPELLWLCLQKKSILISATTKNVNSPIERWAYQQIYQGFSHIFCSSWVQKKKFLQYFSLPKEQLSVVELRPVQIAQRLGRKSQHPFFQGQLYHELERVWGKLPRKQRLILGNFWSHEAQLFQNRQLVRDVLNQKIFVLIVCHKLDEEQERAITEVRRWIGEELAVEVISNHTDLEEVKKILNKGPAVYFLSLKGVLCELYQDFGHAYVGGGFSAQGIHSVFEPYVALAQVYVGPGHHRSTEFETIQDLDPQSLHVCKNLVEIYSEVKKNIDIEVNPQALSRMLEIENKHWQDLLAYVEEKVE